MSFVSNYPIILFKSVSRLLRQFALTNTTRTNWIPVCHMTNTTFMSFGKQQGIVILLFGKFSITCIGYQY